MNMRYLGMLAGIGLILAVAGTAGADSVTYTVSGWGPTQFPGPVTPPEGSPWGPDGYPGDTVELQTYTGSLTIPDLLLGQSTTFTQKINTVLWTIDYTYAGTETQWDYPDHWSDLSFDINAPRGITIGTASGSLSQTGLLESTWFNDYLSFSAGSKTSFLVGTYRVDVTPLGLARVGGSNFSGDNPWIQPSRDLMAKFDVTLVPEPVTMAGLMLGIGSVVTYVRKRRPA